jgi:hypothetical protein
MRRNLAAVEGASGGSGDGGTFAPDPLQGEQWQEPVVGLSSAWSVTQGERWRAGGKHGGLARV